jgi:23S rRNA (cytidine1920-2'-O)/16S rRNA (cytidine1409-2'-O)-methyltransferase
MKTRLDVMLVERGLAESREKAQRLILAGVVRVNGQVADKAGRPCAADAVLDVERPPRFVSRGGEKLVAALDRFPIDVRGLVCLDIGASTGGFTDCLLQHGAARIYAVDVGHGQIDWRLRQDPRVTVMDGVNARYLKEGDLPEAGQFAVIDVSFISLTLILPPVTRLLVAGANLVTLIKPQFEAGRTQVGKGGVVRDPAVRLEVVEKVRHFGTATLGLEWLGSCDSPIAGPAGNIEVLAWWRKPPGAPNGTGCS